MIKLIIAIGILLILVLLSTGCDKERIVTTTETIHDIEYVQLPGDTIIQYDTVTNTEQVIIYEVDTVIQYNNTTDTVYQVNTVYDTVVQTNYVYDTIVQVHNIYDTVVQTNYVYDTIVQVNNIYDTVIQYEYIHTIDTVNIIDTILTVQCTPNEHFAISALEYYSDPLVLALMNLQFGISDGWVLYLSEWQVDLVEASTGTYDIYGYIDYWTLNWSAYYLIEYYWRVSYVGGDPANPRSWQLLEPPTAVGPIDPGLNLRGAGIEAGKALR